MADRYAAENDIEATIEALRACSLAHGDVIARMEDYQRSITGAGLRARGVDSGRSGGADGYGNGYSAELDYLHGRRSALDALISSMERYRRLADPENRSAAA